ncbi:lysophospholipid acyltransferase 5 [Asbolus verrucosus]|uniref:Lysophospholipid acyltransferase 5 n=1 Tax=Asbolus verrucosus TaxID=1661398 RepID=A0A482VE21_ASBVE|nr:lysophospholipid acyltransferase 5 [Asbolus verrucosus]
MSEKDGSVSFNIITNLSNLLGTNEPALRLLFTILAGYPLALIYRKFLYGRNAAVQHVFSITFGFLLGFWNYGLDIFHTVFAIALSYSTLFVLGGTSLSVAIIFIYNIVYLLIGTDSYDINWTMPQCILVLRLIGISFDLYDGHRPPETLSTESKKVALNKCPSVLEFFGHTLFPASFMVGPQFPMKRYQDFVNGKFSPGRTPPPSEKAAALRFGLGVFYLSIFQLLGLLVSDPFMYSNEFADLGFFSKILLLGIWGRYTLYKYISCWLLTEGACILFGLTYNGTDEHGAPLWNGVENVKLSIFENTTEFTHYIQSFNTNTNSWIAQYVYKRLKFLGNRNISQLAALLFLAIWHGFHSGYYVCFFFEFIVVYMEREVKSIVKSNAALSNFFARSSVLLVVNLLLRLYTFIFMGWCLLPFALLTFDRYWTAFSSVYHIGTILFVLWPILYSPILKIIFKRGSKTRVE